MLISYSTSIHTCSIIISNNVDDCERLQHYLNSLYEWSQVWKLNLIVIK